MADFCKNCGAELKPGAKFCGRCAARVGELVPGTPSAPVSAAGDFVKSNKMPKGVALGMDERIVRQYRIGQYTLRQGAVDVIVTNKRVIRYEDSVWFGMRTNRMDDIELQAVNGVSCMMSRSISVIGLAVSLILALAGLTAIRQIIIGLSVLALAVVILLCSFRPSMVFCLYGPVSRGMLDTSVNVMGRLFGHNNSSMIFQFKPTAETTRMLKEIGACINDLKNLGERAVAVWSE